MAISQRQIRQVDVFRQILKQMCVIKSNCALRTAEITADKQQRKDHPLNPDIAAKSGLACYIIVYRNDSHHRKVNQRTNGTKISSITPGDKFVSRAMRRRYDSSRSCHVLFGWCANSMRCIDKNRYMCVE
jgi:hypothetical protein